MKIKCLYLFLYDITTVPVPARDEPLSPTSTVPRERTSSPDLHLKMPPPDRYVMLLFGCYISMQSTVLKIWVLQNPFNYDMLRL